MNEINLILAVVGDGDSENTLVENQITEEVDYYSQEIHGPFELFPIGDFKLEEGGEIKDLQLAYSTFGELSPEKDNVILVTTWYSGTSKVMEDTYIGEGRALDPNKYFIIIINQIGSGLSSSPSNTTGPNGGKNFPRVRISDDVRAQKMLLEKKFGINSLELAIGGSMGAQQVWEWAVRYPEWVKRAAVMGGTAKNKPHTFLITDIMVEAITSDPGFKDGNYDSSQEVSEGLRRHADLWAAWGFSGIMYKNELYKAMEFESVEAFKDGFPRAYFAPMDPNNLLSMAWKWQRGDVSRNSGGELAAALGKIKAKVFAMPVDTDLIFPVADVKSEIEMVPNGELRVLSSNFGHFGMLGLQPDYAGQIDGYLNELLDSN